MLRRAGRPRCRCRPALVGEGAGHLARRVAVVADAEPEVEAVGLVAELEEDVPHGQRVLAAATRRRAPARPGASMSKSLMALATWSRHSRRKCSAQKLALWRRMSMTAGSLHTVHFTSHPPEMTGRISTVSASSSSDVAGHERVAHDHEHRLAVQRRGGRGARGPAPGPSTSSSRFGLRSSTFTTRAHPCGCVVCVIRSDSPGAAPRAARSRPAPRAAGTGAARKAANATAGPDAARPRAPAAAGEPLERCSRRASDAADLDHRGAPPALAAPEQEGHRDDADGDDRAHGDEGAGGGLGASRRRRPAARGSSPRGRCADRDRVLGLRVHRPGPFRFTMRHTTSADEQRPRRATTIRYGTHDEVAGEGACRSRVCRARSSREEQQDASRCRARATPPTP